MLAILAAALYAINSPFSKLLLDYMPSTLMAGFLYIGAGLGMGAVALIRKAKSGESPLKNVVLSSGKIIKFFPLGKFDK